MSAEPGRCITRDAPHKGYADGIANGMRSGIGQRRRTSHAPILLPRFGAGHALALQCRLFRGVMSLGADAATGPPMSFPTFGDRHCHPDRSLSESVHRLRPKGTAIYPSCVLGNHYSGRSDTIVKLMVEIRHYCEVTLSVGSGGLHRDSAHVPGCYEVDMPHQAGSSSAGQPRGR